MNNYPQAAGVSVQNKNKCGSDGDSAAAPFLQGWKVKKLEWGESRGRWFHKSMAPRYEVICGAIGDFVLQYNCQDLSRHPTVEAAKAAAQADYEARILSAIEPAPSPRAQASEEAAWNKAIERAVIELEANWPHKTTPEIRDAIRALSSQPVADGWLPIETAPIGNGSNRFLAYITGHGPCVCYRNKNGTVLSVDGRTILRATHWRALPASPGASE